MASPAAMAGWADSIDRLLDESSRYTTALRAAFVRYQTPPPGNCIPKDLLLPALQFFVQKLQEELDPKAGKICLRPIFQEDIDAILEDDSAIDIEQPIDIDHFDKVAKKMLKRIALDRGKRLGFFVVGGILLVHITKNTLKKVPFIGPPICSLLNIVMPTTLVGPAVGVAGAMYL